MPRKYYSTDFRDVPIDADLGALDVPGFMFTEPPRVIRHRRKENEKKEFTPFDEWIEDNVFDESTINTQTWNFEEEQVKKIKLAQFQRDILRHAFTLRADGTFPYRTIIWSQIKKSGKTMMAGAVGACFAAQVEPPNLVLTIANNQEQSAGRIFNAARPTLRSLGCKVPMTSGAKPEIQLTNGTLFKAIPNNYEGQAGANYGLTLWSELWAFTLERGTRLWDELVPVPTRKNSIRWVETYVGFEDESKLLLNQFLKVFDDTSERKLAKGARVVEELEHIRTLGSLEGDKYSHLNTKPTCYAVEEEGLLYFHDHERRMTWQQGARGDAYYAEQKSSMRKSAYVRLCENRWQSSAGDFLEEDWLTRSLRLTTVTQDALFEPMVIAIDASQRHDTTSIVGTRYNAETERFETPLVIVFDPKGEDIDLDETVAETIEGLFNAGLIATSYNEKTEEDELELWHDPYQMHQVAVNLAKKGIKSREFSQGKERTLADTHLWKLYRDDMIDNIDSPDLKAHCQAAKAVEQENEMLRIVKGTRSNAGKVDATVSQSMSAWKCSLTQIPDDSGDFSVIAQDVTDGWSVV
jgi:phage terminase large subunit-like protein